jgi:glycosyltransferase involved in cell wall biosynthesis
MLKSGEPDFPFCLCWANENWTRRWDGMEQEVLVEQSHTPEADAAFIHEVMPALLDRRYIRRDGKPVLLVYRADQLADAPATARAWREAARAAGLPGLHLCAVWKVDDPRPLGFDALVEFPPHHFPRRSVRGRLPGLDPNFSGEIFDYGEGVRALRPRDEEFPVHRGVMPRWDNTPRRDNSAWIFHGSSPELYRSWLERVIRESNERPGSEDQFVFVNAWNEWAEGAFLEPSQREGRRYLEATRAAIQAASGRRGASTNVLVFGHDACRAGAQLFLLRLVEALVGRGDLDVTTLLRRGGELEADFARQAPLRLLPAPDDADSIRAEVRAALASMSPAPTVAICNTVLSWQAAAVCAEMGIPVLSFVFELPTSIDALVGEAGLRALVESSERTLFASEFARHEIARRYALPTERLIAFPAGWPATPVAAAGARRATRDEVRRRLGISRDAFVVLGCGAVHYRKGPDLFVQVAREAMGMAGGEGLEFLWAGGPQDTTEMLEWCRHDLAASGLSERVRFLGQMSDPSAFFDAADAFLVTSREDPFPLVNLEALARGLPVVAFEGAGGAPEALVDGAGLLVPYLDVKEMARAVLRLAGAPRYREEVQRRALAAHRERYEWPAFLARFYELLQAELEVPAPAESDEPVAARS